MSKRKRKETQNDEEVGAQSKNRGGIEDGQKEKERGR